jgi:hypothetical protein
LCSAAYGGAITSSSFLTLDYVTFSRCRAREGGAIDLRTEETNDVEFTSSLFRLNTAVFFGSLYRSSRGQFRIVHTNFSQESASECVGCGEGKFGDFQCRFLVLSGCSAGAHNGGLCFREMDLSVIEYGFFENCSHDSNEQDAGAVFLMYDNPLDSSLQKCVFVSNRYGGSHTITCASGHSLMVSDCCFSGRQISELNTKNIIVENCVFDQGECLYESVGRPFGFDRSRNVPFSIHLPRQTQTGTPPLRKMKGHSGLLGISLLASVVIAFLLTVLETAYRHLRKVGRRIPRAIL